MVDLGRSTTVGQGEDPARGDQWDIAAPARVVDLVGVDQPSSKRRAPIAGVT